MDHYFYWWGVAVNAIGALGIVGLVAWQALEFWVKFNGLRRPLIEWYWEKLKREKSNPAA